jgi:hypothetical protein
MPEFTYATEWFAETIVKHGKVTKTEVLADGRVRVTRKDLPSITVAPIVADRIDRAIVGQVLEAGIPTVIVRVPKDAHYDWTAREFAEEQGSTINTVRETYSFMDQRDPRAFVDKHVDYARRSLRQHTQVWSVEMICEATMRLRRRGGLSDVIVAVEYEYEFSEEALVGALERHPDADVILNANPNGRPTSAALSHARHAKVPIFRLSELMGALNYDGEQFRSYQPPERGRSHL